jgi:hypothetical protein
MATISQLPAPITLRKFRGDEFAIVLDFDIDLTGYTFSNDIYRIVSATPAASSGMGGDAGFTNITTASVGSFDVTVLSLLQGQVRLLLTEAASDALGSGRYRWFFRWVAPGDITRTVLNGTLELVDDLSQASGVNSDGQVITVSASQVVPGGGLPVSAGVAGLLNDLVWGG